MRRWSYRCTTSPAIPDLLSVPSCFKDEHVADFPEQQHTFESPEQGAASQTIMIFHAFCGEPNSPVDSSNSVENPLVKTRPAQPWNLQAGLNGL